MSQAQYPRAGLPHKEVSHFAHRAVRLMLKSALAQEIGPEAVLLLVFIVHTEDAAHYRRAIRFYNHTLADVLGISVASLKRFRTKAVRSGWLHYEPGVKRCAARYWLTLPRHVEGLDDSPTDEGSCDEVAQPERESVPESVQKASRKRATTNPVPVPVPVPKGKAGVSRNVLRWAGSITSEEFSTLDSGLKRHAQAVHNGWIGDGIDLRRNFMRAWQYTSRRHAAGKVDHPGTYFGSVLMRGLHACDWSGSGKDDDAVKVFLRQVDRTAPRLPVTVDLVAKLSAAQPVGEDVDG